MSTLSASAPYNITASYFSCATIVAVTQNCHHFIHCMYSSNNLNSEQHSRYLTPPTNLHVLPPATATGTSQCRQILQVVSSLTMRGEMALAMLAYSPLTNLPRLLAQEHFIQPQFCSINSSLLSKLTQIVHSLPRKLLTNFYGT